MNRIVAAILMYACIAIHAYANPVVRVALFDIVPYAYEHDGHFMGAYPEITMAIVKQAGDTPRIALYPFARVGSLIESNHADLTLSFLTTTLEHGAIQLGVVLNVESILVGRPGIALPSLSAVNGKTIGRIRGGCLDLAQNPEVSAKYYDLNNFESGILMLKAGRIDALCTTTAAYIHEIGKQHMHIADFSVPLVLARREVWLHSAKNMPQAQQDKLRDALEVLKRNGTIDRIWNRYLRN